MAVIAGDLVTRLGIDGRKFQSGLDNARGAARSFVADVGKIVSGLALYDIGKGAVTGLFGLAKETVNLAATAETAAVQFEVLTGSAESAAAVMDDINKFAADTPFESMEITQAAKQLIAFGGNAGTVIGELQTIGDLSAGMGIPLTELAELYGKARIQGRLFMEDINQLQGRGINVTAELAKEFRNVRDAVEKGQVNFGHLERALKAMTSEGGAFAGMMQDMSKTFEGQTSTLLDNIKAIGRDIGEMILPRLTEMVDRANKVLAAFNALGDARWKVLGDVLVASLDVAMETIKIHWKQMLKDMTKEVALFSVDVIPGVAAARKAAAGNLVPERAGGGLDAAQKRLDGLLGKLDAAKAANAAAAAAAAADVPKRFEGDTPAINNLNAVFAEWDRLSAANREAWKSLNEVIDRGASDAEIVAADAAAKAAKAALMNHADVVVPAAGKAVGQEKFTSGISSMFEKLKNSPLMGTIDSLKMGAGGMIDRAKIQAEAIGGTLSNWFNSPDWEKSNQKEEPRLAGAMQKGSQEAFSTIFAAMLTRQKDPVVKATEKGAASVVKAIKENKPQMMFAMGAVNP